MVIELGESLSGAEARDYFTIIRGSVKEFFHCCIGALTTKRLAVYVPVDGAFLEYDEKIRVLERVENLEQKLRQKIGVPFRIGIGTVRKLEQAPLSYKDAVRALRFGNAAAGSAEEAWGGVVERAKYFIRKNYRRDLSLDEVAREVNISSYYLSKLFKEETGENFIGYLTACRMEAARKMLADRNASIKEICIETGYSDPNYFSRIFKKTVGVSPTEYRKGLK